jgi:GT2 family glycosyltransferase
LLQACLDTVRRHAPNDTEVIVVDDGSTGAKVSQVAAAFDRMRVIRLPKQRGFCVAANAGIKQAGGGIIELLNDDTEVTAGWADAAQACFADPQVAAVAPLVLRRPKTETAQPKIDSAGDRYYLGGIAGKRGHGEALQAQYLQPCRVFGASASSAFYRREVLLRVGAFPEFFQSYFEDVDLAFRIHRAGYHIQFEPRSRVYHHVASSHGNPRRVLLERQSLNEERVFWRNVCGPTLRDALPRHLLVLAGKSWKRCREGGLIPFVCGRLRLLGELAQLRAHHCWLQTLGPGANLESWLVERHFWAGPDLR